MSSTRTSARTERVQDARRRAAFTGIELLATLAALVIILGVAISMARYVRDRSAGRITRQVMVTLRQAMAQYEKAHGIGGVNRPTQR